MHASIERCEQTRGGRPLHPAYRHNRKWRIQTRGEQEIKYNRGGFSYPSFDNRPSYRPRTHPGQRGDESA